MKHSHLINCNGRTQSKKIKTSITEIRPIYAIKSKRTETKVSKTLRALLHFDVQEREKWCNRL